MKRSEAEVAQYDVHADAPGSAGMSPGQGRQRSPIIRVICCAMLVLSIGAVLGEPCQARDAEPTLAVAPELPLVPGQESTLDIRITPESAIPPRALIVIRGAPAGVRFSQGRAFGPGVWVIPAAAVTSLKLTAPSDYDGGGVITLALATLDGKAIAEVLVVLVDRARASLPVNSPAEPASGRTGAFTATSPPAASERANRAPPKLTGEKRAELLLLLQKGKDSFRIGNVMHARQFYLRAAENGLAEAALELAATYDPVELAQVPGVIGVLPDPALARKWYEKAKALGSMEAEARLAALARQ
jgi:hypothetical protein